WLELTRQWGYQGRRRRRQVQDRVARSRRRKLEVDEGEPDRPSNWKCRPRGRSVGLRAGSGGIEKTAGTGWECSNPGCGCRRRTGCSRCRTELAEKKQVDHRGRGTVLVCHSGKTAERGHVFCL
ncbi:hypothetical protein LTR39_004050, partial [Cryomyces antarcticus]